MGDGKGVHKTLGKIRRENKHFGGRLQAFFDGAMHRYLELVLDFIPASLDDYEINQKYKHLYIYISKTYLPIYR